MLDLEDYESTNEEVVESAPPPQPPKKKRRRYDNKMKRDAVKHCILDCKGNKLEQSVIHLIATLKYLHGSK